MENENRSTKKVFLSSAASTMVAHDKNLRQKALNLVGNFYN